MSIVSHLHQLFNAETCQAYIHTLRWKDRPLQCPRCLSLNVGSWGTYHAQPGLKRYRCKEKGCKRTFNDLTGTLLDGSKRSPAHWILATFLLCLSCSSRRRLLLDSGVVEVAMSYNPIFAIISSSKPLFFKGLKNGLKALDNVEA
jgi:transposase-like protein